MKNFVELYSKHSDLFLVHQATHADEVAIFLDGEHTFAGGRYGMARELMLRKLPFLATHTLGEVCHIVQLAIQHRRLIVYHRKMLKPIQTVLCQNSPTDGTNVSTE